MDADMATRPHSLRRRSSRGFTLIEVLISILVFSFGVLGAVALQAVAVQMGTQNGDRSRASMLANEMVSTLWAKQTASPASGDLAAWQGRVSNAAASGLPNGAGAVSSCGTNCATVTVTWKAPSAKAADPSNKYSTNVVIQ
jgi:type IV pilus assembly protein PilV